MEYTKIKEINRYVSKSVNPAKMPDTIFEMYSVPAYETGHPEYLYGREIASSKVVVKKNDILLCKINPRINRVWIVLDESDNQNIASSEWIVIRTDEYNPEFLVWYFRTPQFQQKMMSEVTGIGGSLTRAQPKRVAEYLVPVFDRKRQDRIATVLNKIANIIDLRKKELKAYDELIKSRFVEMFGTVKENPYNFPTATLKEVCHKITDGKHGGCEQEANSGYYYIGAREIYDGAIHYDTAPQITYADFTKDYRRCNIEQGDMVIVNTGATIGKSAIAVSSLTERTLLQKSVALLKVKTDMVSAEFLRYCYMANPSMYMVKSASAQPNLLLSKMNATVIYLPPRELQEQFADFVAQTDKSKLFVNVYFILIFCCLRCIINTSVKSKLSNDKGEAL